MSARTTTWFAWRPTVDTAVALASAVAMVFCYGSTGLNSLAATLIGFVLLGNVVVAVVFPAWWQLRRRGAGPDSLGITTRRWQFALALSVVLALGTYLGRFRAQSAGHPTDDLLPHLLANALLLWEPFFVHGWLQSRFTEAFGVLGGILAAAACFAAYHVLVMPPAFVAMMAAVGLFSGTAFALAGRNLLALWPITWAVTSASGTLDAGMLFGWPMVANSAVVLAVQVAVIAVLARRRPARARSAQ